MKIILLFMFVFLSALYSTAQTDLFFSEYIEGSGNNKALEIYNPTSQTIDLSNYYVLRFSNGQSTFAEGGVTHLVGTIAPYKTFVLVNGQTPATSTPSSPACSPVLQAMADQLDGIYPAPTYMNGNDAMALVKTTGGVPPSSSPVNYSPVDLFGQIGLGALIYAETGWSDVKDATLSYTVGGVAVTGKIINYIVQKYATNGTSSGPYWMAWTANHTLIRKPSIITGVKVNPVPFVVTKEWDTLAAVVDTAGHLVYEDIWTNLGKHACVADPTMSLNKISPSSSNVAVYPNPVTTDRFTITSQVAITEIEIFSVIGQSVYKQLGKKGQQQIDIESSGLEKGIYLVKVTSSDKNAVVKKILIK
jgi:hypothetical protein